MDSVMTIEQLGQDFTALFSERAFRLETLDYYVAANEREPYARYLAGQPVDPAWRKPWAGLVRHRGTATGATRHSGWPSRWLSTSQSTTSPTRGTGMSEWGSAKFRKGSDSNDVGCVEVAFAGDRIGVRDSKSHGAGPVLGFNEHEWDVFVRAVKAGEFDLPG
jgi:hypothetical protein